MESAISDNGVIQVRRYYELVDAGQLSALLTLFAPDSTYDRPGYPTMVGQDAIERFYNGQRLVDRGKHTLATVVSDGYDVAVQGEFNGVLRDGKTVSVRFADFFTLNLQFQFARRHTFFFTPLI